MTCIVGFANEKKMILMGDSAGTSGYDVVIRSDPKVFTLEQKGGPNVLIGFTSSFRMGQLLMTLEVPRDDIGEPFGFMIARFIPAVRKLFAQGGFLVKENGREEGGKFLVGYRGKLFTIDSDFQVGIAADQYDSIGCGESYALGVLDVLLCQKDADPRQALTVALQLAEKRSGAVRGPFRTVEVDLEAEAERKKKKKKNRKKKKRKK